ncbi:hypothetical protein, partial [Phormidesmis priestleyi]
LSWFSAPEEPSLSLGSLDRLMNITLEPGKCQAFWGEIFGKASKRPSEQGLLLLSGSGMSRFVALG